MLRIKISIIPALLSILFLSVCFASGQSIGGEESNWEELKGEHFIIYFNPSGEGITLPKDDLEDAQVTMEFVKEVLEQAEVYYKNIALDLGYPRYSEFWTWDRRVKIYIYPDHNSFLRSTEQPAWSEGMADYTKKEILSYYGSRGFKDSILPHEMAHLVFRDFIGFKEELPLWLDEGVAQWEETAKRQEIKNYMKKMYDNDSILTLSDMMSLDIRRIKQKDGVYIRSIISKEGDRGVLFLNGENLVQTYYTQAVSLVGFLIEKFGSVDFSNFCRQLRDGKKFEDALLTSYPLQIRNLDEFEKRWRKYIDESQ
jgi:hypothetical protein